MPFLTSYVVQLNYSLGIVSDLILNLSSKTLVNFMKMLMLMLNLFADNFFPGRRRANLMPFLIPYVEQHNSLELKLMLNLSFADNFVPGRRRVNLMPFLTSYVPADKFVLAPYIVQEDRRSARQITLATQEKQQLTQATTWL